MLDAFRKAALLGAGLGVITTEKCINLNKKFFQIMMAH